MDGKNDIQIMVQCAKMYYTEKMTQAEIAKKLGISAFRRVDDAFGSDGEWDHLKSISRTHTPTTIRFRASLRTAFTLMTAVSYNDQRDQ